MTEDKMYRCVVTDSRLLAVQFLVVVSLLLSVLNVVESACGAENAMQYEPINETMYDRNYSSIASTGKNPLGFYRATWIYNQPDHDPCIKITAPDASQRRLEIKVETVPESRICFKDQNSGNQCFQGRGSSCRETPGNTIYIEFVCDSQCEEADISFWYRLVLSPLPSEQDPEIWCFDRPTEYPQDLATAPPDVTLPVYTTPKPKDDTGSAARTASWSFLITVMLMIGWSL